MSLFCEFIMTYLGLKGISIPPPPLLSAIYCVLTLTVPTSEVFFNLISLCNERNFDTLALTDSS